MLLTHWLFLEGVPADFMYIYTHIYTHRYIYIYIYNVFSIYTHIYIITIPFNLITIKAEFKKEQFAFVPDKVALPFMCFSHPETLTPQILF